MADFELKDLLQAIGPTASLIFAAWIFLSFLQTRYSDAYNRYRELIAELRKHGENDSRRRSLVDQVLEYKLRCEQMRKATQIGVISAIFLISAQILAALGTMLQIEALKWITAVLALVGLILVIWAASHVLTENARIQLIIDSDISDMPDLVDAAHDRRRTGAEPHASGADHAPGSARAR